MFLLLFIEQPTITVQPQAHEKTEGDTVSLSCKADGNPVPTISWTINGSPIDVRGNSRISFSENKEQLTIRNVERTDSGAYRCVARNTFGNATSDAASLDIQCNEKFDADSVTSCDEVANSLYSTKYFIVHFFLTQRVCLVGCEHIVQLISMASNCHFISSWAIGLLH